MPKKKKDFSMNMEDETTLLEEILDFVKIFVVCTLGIIIFSNFIFYPVRVQGRSMHPTLKDHNFGFTSIISTYFSDPKRDQVVVVKMPAIKEDGTEGTELWVKRVIGMPGDTIEGKDGQVIINGEAIDESAYLDVDYVAQTEEELGYFNMDFSPVTLGENEYFLMGDNRPHSKDSRYSVVGPIQRDQIFGYGVFIILPLTEFGGN